jgi:serine/threonine-protein kinase
LRAFRVIPGTERVTLGSSLSQVERDGERYVCKRLTPRGRAEPWMRELLVAEGRALAILGGEGAPRLVEAGEDESDPWVVMELVRAPPLAARMGARDVAWAGAAARAVYATLERVHTRGVVHGDVSPANVLFDGRLAWLIDFGLARWAGAPALPEGPFRGTLLYVAPELARGEAFDVRADLFATAASLLHTYSAETPRPQPSSASLLLSAGEQPIDAWAARASEGLPVPLARTLRACCAFDPAARPASATEVCRAL